MLSLTRMTRAIGARLVAPRQLRAPSATSAVLLGLLFVVQPARLARAQDAGASLSGAVHDSGGRPLRDVEIGVLGSGARVRTNAAGEYRILNLLEGRATVSARRLGFLTVTRALRLGAGDNPGVDFVLAGTAQALEGAVVTAPLTAEDRRLAGFRQRSTQQVGHFVTRERIDRANSATLVDVLREIPGVRVGGQTTSGRLVRIRSSTCPPLVFVDGFPATAGEFDLDMVDLKAVEGIEVYAGLGSLPAEFTGPRDLDRCGVIAIWSRAASGRPRLSAPPPSAPAGSLPTGRPNSR